MPIYLNRYIDDCESGYVYSEGSVYCASTSLQWSYGVTCWEVFSLGCAPYPGVQNHEILNYITKHNQRLENPSLCPRKM